MTTTSSSLPHHHDLPGFHGHVHILGVTGLPDMAPFGPHRGISRRRVTRSAGTMNLTTILSSWSGALFLYVVGDAAATAYLSVAGDRIGGLSFVVAAMIGVVVFAPSIILFGY